VKSVKSEKNRSFAKTLPPIANTECPKTFETPDLMSTALVDF